jgi:hypothetical protein
MHRFALPDRDPGLPALVLAKDFSHSSLGNEKPSAPSFKNFLRCNIWIPGLRVSNNYLTELSGIFNAPATAAKQSAQRQMRSIPPFSKQCDIANRISNRLNRASIRTQ